MKRELKKSSKANATAPPLFSAAPASAAQASASPASAAPPSAAPPGTAPPRGVLVSDSGLSWNDPVQQLFAEESETWNKSRKWPLSQKYFEYLMYASAFPNLIPSEKVKLKSKIEEILGFSEFKHIKISDVDLSKCSGFPILESYAIDHGFSLK